MKRRILVSAKHGQFWAWENDLITNQLLQYGAHTRNELSMVIDHIEDDDIVLDIGAHIGTYSIPIALKAQKGRVFAIEADASSYELLSKNIHLNNLGSRIVVDNFLATGLENSYGSAQKIINNSGANYFVKKHSGEGVTCGVNLATWIADRDLKKIHFIKMDVEGMEYELLSSILHILERDQPKLYIEIVEDQLRRNEATPLEIQSLLDPIGYRYYVNRGDRNSDHDKYIMKEISDFNHSSFYDVLALPPDYETAGHFT